MLYYRTNSIVYRLMLLDPSYSSGAPFGMKLKIPVKGLISTIATRDLIEKDRDMAGASRDNAIAQANSLETALK